MFYHGSDSEFEIFNKKLSQDYEMPQGSFFSTNRFVAKKYGDKQYKTFLKFDSPIVIDLFGNSWNSERDYILSRIDEIGLDGADAVVLKNIRDDKDGAGKIVADTILVFDSKQIKEVGNRGKDGRYFDGENPNIYYKEAASKDDTILPKNLGDEAVDKKKGEIILFNLNENELQNELKIARQKHPLSLTTDGEKSEGRLRWDLKKSLEQELEHRKVGKAEVLVLENKDFEATIARVGLGKMSSKVAIDKSVANGFTRSEHLLACANIKEIFGNAFRVFTKTNPLVDKNLFVHRFAMPFDINNKSALAKITLKEVKNTKDAGTRFYSLELILERPSGLGSYFN